MKPTNRILLAFRDWEDRQNELKLLLKAGSADERTLRKLELEHLRQANHRLHDTLRPDEKPFMRLLENQIARLEKQLYPNALLRLFHRVKDRFLDGPAYRERQARQRDANMEALKQQLRESGLCSVAGQLERHLDPDHRQVRLPLDCQLGPDKRLNLSLHFDKDVYGNFQLHRLDGTLLEKGKPTRTHEFELKAWPGLRANQVLSLLEGRALKQHFTDVLGHASERWVELGPDGVRHYAPDHPFDIAASVAAIPNITYNRDDLIRYLENGQRVSTHWKHEGHFQNISIQADPANSIVKLFDARQRPVTAEQLNQAARQYRARKTAMPAQSIPKRIKNGQKVH